MSGMAKRKLRSEESDEEELLTYDSLGGLPAAAVSIATARRVEPVNAYDRCSSDKERENLLADIPVHRGDGVTATTRWIGPELPRRVHLQKTSEDPDLDLDFTG